ncbi:hypothetical protein ACQ4PT_032768 [Festuca glaucescens]
MGAGDGRAVAAVSAAAATNAVRARTDDEVAAVGAGDDRVVAAESAAAAGDDRVVAAVSAAATADVSIGATYAVRHAPMHATVDPLVHGPVQRPVDQALVAQRAVVADARVMVGPLVDRPVDRPAFPVLEASAADSNLAAAGGVGEGSFRVGALTVSLPASPCKFSTNEPPSLQTLDSVAGPFVPRLLLGLEAFASPASPAAAHQDGPLGQDDAGPFGQDDDGLGDVAGANCQVLSLSNPPSPVLDASRVDELSDDEDGEGFVRTFENMWDLTPPTELLQELPAEYSTESALADLVDNSLQALWSNGKKDRKLIRITIDQEKMVIFDTGRGMDGSDENSISKW